MNDTNTKCSEVLRTKEWPKGRKSISNYGEQESFVGITKQARFKASGGFTEASKYIHPGETHFKNRGRLRGEAEWLVDEDTQNFNSIHNKKR